MGQRKILLLCPGTTESLGSALREILESHLHLGAEFQQECIEAYETDSKRALRRSFSGLNLDLIFLIPSADAIEQTFALIQVLRKEFLKTPIIVITEADSPDAISALLRAGATDFITPPLRAINTIPRVNRLLPATEGDQSLTCTLKEKLGLRQLVGESQAFLSEIKKISVVAKCDASVLISGETGTGKELCARAIHYLSPRERMPFIPINCGAIPVELVENELFGHERGAFTGASVSQPGLIQEGDGGTLFLDEVDCLPLLAQVKVLRFLQEKEYRALGSTKMRQADVRIIAATNLDLEEAMCAGKLRRDLYYRLNIIPLKLPPLRQRKEDIPLLTRHFLAKYAAEFDKEVVSYSPEALQALMSYEWPGNVRELEHVVERAVALSERSVIQAADFSLPRPKAATRQPSFHEAKADLIAQFERDYIVGLLKTYQGNITRAAQAAQKNRRAFWQLIRKHGINAQSYTRRAPHGPE